MGVSSGRTGKRVQKIEVAIAVAWSKSEGVYYAWSPQLRCVRDGKTAEEAVAMCKEALEVLFEGLIERDTLKEYLASHGYKRYRLPQEGRLYDRNAAKGKGLELPCPERLDRINISVGSSARV